MWFSFGRSLFVVRAYVKGWACSWTAVGVRATDPVVENVQNKIGSGARKYLRTELKCCLCQVVRCGLKNTVR